MELNNSMTVLKTLHVTCHVRTLFIQNSTQPNLNVSMIECVHLVNEAQLEGFLRRRQLRKLQHLVSRSRPDTLHHEIAPVLRHCNAESHLQ